MYWETDQQRVAKRILEGKPEGTKKSWETEDKVDGQYRRGFTRVQNRNMEALDWMVWVVILKEAKIDI
mgnify:CR=1 FL=1